MSKGRRKKSLKEYEAEAGFDIWEISPQQFDSASHDDTLELTCNCGNKYTSKKSQVARRLTLKRKLVCRSCSARAGAKKR